jgi:catechol 2,3-dioxygenase-like lactoylglutathione lyase family enzyme
MIRFQRVTPFLATRDVGRTVAFYTQVLGFRVQTLDPPEQPTLAILDRDVEPSGQGASIIFDASLWSDPPALTGQIHFDLSPGGVLELYDRVKDRAEILWGPEVYDYGRREFSCRDPNGYALVFSERTSDPPTCSA